MIHGEAKPNVSKAALMLLCVVVCSLVVAAAPSAFASDCGVAVDPWQVQLSTPMSMNRLWSDPLLQETEPAEPDAGVLQDIVALGGMSCDGGLSCSAQLVASLERIQQARRAAESAPSPGGPMCLPGDPDCTLTPGEPVGGHTVELTHPLAPYIDEGDFTIRPAPEPEDEVGPAGRKRLFGREIVKALERPPRF